MEGSSLFAAIAKMRAGYDELAASSVDAATHPELLAALGELEVLTRQLPTQSHRMIARLQREASPVELGAKSLREVLCRRLRISLADARRRLAEATELGPRTAISGEPLAPLLAPTATAQAAGSIGPEHVSVIRGFLADLPLSVDVLTREQAEATLVGVAAGFGPDELRKAAARLAAYLDQDGPEPDDAERARKRCVSLGRQQADGMSKLTGLVDPQLRATLEAILAKWAAPGMCNPDDEHPCITGTPSQAQIDGDTRSHGQRTHDALTAIGRSVLSSGELGQHNGLPATIVASTTLAELRSLAGCAVTGGGTLLPMTDVIRMATHSRPYLAVFDTPTEVSLYHGRSRRLASPGQRIVLHARDRGCTFPGCTVPGYGCQVHHLIGWKDDGQTDIDVEVLACGGHNRLAEEEGWQVRIRPDGTVEWIPPPHLDTGQTRTNVYHHPERLLAPDE